VPATGPDLGDEGSSGTCEPRGSQQPTIHGDAGLRISGRLLAGLPGTPHAIDRKGLDYV
jgi:hypothetical protein